MPILWCAFTAGEFLDECVHELPEGFEIYNPTSQYPFEWWGLH